MMKLTVFQIVLAPLLVWLALDLGHAAWVRLDRNAWEKGIERDADGVRLGCGDFSAGDGDPALLLVHGFADSPALWQDLAPVFADRGFTCRAVRLPGFCVPLDRQKEVVAEDWRRTVESEFTELKNSHETVWVVAHSLGAAVTLDLVQSGRVKPDGLVFMAPLIDVSTERSPLLHPRSWHRIGKSTTLFTGQLKSVFALNSVDPTLESRHPRPLYHPLNIFDALFEVTAAAQQSAASVACPALFILADADPVVDSVKARGLYDRIENPDKECLVFDGTGHIIPRDARWQDAGRATMKFIEAHSTVHAENQPSPIL